MSYAIKFAFILWTQEKKYDVKALHGRAINISKECAKFFLMVDERRKNFERVYKSVVVVNHQQVANAKQGKDKTFSWIRENLAGPHKWVHKWWGKMVGRVPESRVQGITHFIEVQKDN